MGSDVNYNLQHQIDECEYELKNTLNRDIHPALKKLMIEAILKRKNYLESKR